MQLDREAVRCDCGSQTHVMPSDLTYNQDVECEACGKFFSPTMYDKVEAILQWLAGL